MTVARLAGLAAAAVLRHRSLKVTRRVPHKVVPFMR